MSDVVQESDISYLNLFKTMTQGVVYQNGEGKNRCARQSVYETF